MPAFTSLPPPFVGHPLLYMVTLFSILLVVLLACEWLWRLIWSLFERPAPLKSPTTVLRVVFVLLLSGTLLRICPDLWLMMRWPAMTATGREALAMWDKRLDSLAFLPFSWAWLAARLGEPILRYQLERQPLPIHLWPTWRQLKRPLKIGVGVLAIAFALTYLR